MDTDIIEHLVTPMYDWRGPDEECAVVVSREATVGSISLRENEFVLIPVPNRSQTPATKYEIRKSDYQAVASPSDRLVAVVHTHLRPGGQEPSYDDVKGLPDDVLGLVVHPRSKSWTLYDKTVGVLNFKDGVH